MFFIREGTHLYIFLMILACVGEYPVKSVYLLGYERVWKQKINEWHKYQIRAYASQPGRVGVSGEGFHPLTLF